jgi:TetR/AcrR family transcriptional repressor of mexJK operon
MMSLSRHVQSPSGIYLRKNARRKYDAILKSASRLFMKHGYTRTSMDTVAADAGVSKQTVYSYFKNKDVLFCQMIEEECVRHDPPETLLANPALSPEDTLFHIGLSYQELILSPRALAIHRLVIAEAERHPRIAQLFFDSGPLRMRAIVAKFIERQMAIPAGEADRIAKHYLNMIKGGYHFRMLLKLKPTPSKKELEDHVRQMTQMFFKLYGKS